MVDNDKVERDRLRAELAKAQQHDSWRATAHWKRRADAAEAATARVRELCRESLGSPSTTVRAWSRDVLRALDGAE